MNILAAAHYLKLGYRIRRTSWKEESFVKLDCTDQPEYFARHEYWTIGGGKTTHHTYIGGGMNQMTVDDMLAEDWELITTGIRKHWNKYGTMEYEDDTDWDNYVSPSSSWGDPEDDEE